MQVSVRREISNRKCYKIKEVQKIFSYSIENILFFFCGGVLQSLIDMQPGQKTKCDLFFAQKLISDNLLCRGQAFQNQQLPSRSPPFPSPPPPPKKKDPTKNEKQQHTHPKPLSDLRQFALICNILNIFLYCCPDYQIWPVNTISMGLATWATWIAIKKQSHYIE